jgi:hypothetical protein
VGAQTDQELDDDKALVAISDQIRTLPDALP